MSLTKIALLPSVPLSKHRTLPQSAAVYIVTADDGRVLYVGCTTNLRTRWITHHRRKQMEQLKAEARISWESTGAERLRERERAYIQELRPEWNSQRFPRTNEPSQKAGMLIRCWRRIEDVGIREAAQQIGVSHGTLSRIERGEQIDAVTMMKLLRWLFEGETKNSSRVKGGK